LAIDVIFGKSSCTTIINNGTERLWHCLEVPMKSIRRILAIAVVILAIMAYWAYRNTLAIVRAAEYQPAALTLSNVPAGTEIRVVLSNGITETTRPGDTVKGFIAAPVVVGNIPLLPTGIQLNAHIESIRKNDDTASVLLQFDEAVFRGKSTRMDCTPVWRTVPVTSDLNTLASGFNTVTGAGIGLALGTAAEDSRTAAQGLAQGAATGVPQPNIESPQVTVRLTRDLQIRAQ
jgi:hypothetical protein